jgi:branched-chain amino acid transport system permease protein
MRISLTLEKDRNTSLAGLIGAVAGPVLAAVLITVFAAIVIGAASLTEVVLLFGINAIMVVGFQLFVGSTGIVSFGHVAFMGLGAYAAGVFSIPIVERVKILPQFPQSIAGIESGMLLSLLIGASVAAFVALLMGLAIMRLSGAAASIATLGMLIIVSNLLAQATPVTRGPQSLYGVPARTDFGWVFGALVVVVAISALYKWSAIGIRARAARDDTIAAESSGIVVFRGRLSAFVLSAAITGIGGALYAQLLTAYSPASFFLPQLITIIAMAIIGGILSITGALVGATLVAFLNEATRQLERGFSVGETTVQLPSGISIAVLGVALIVVLRFRPAGVLGSSELQVSFGSSKKSPAGKGSPSLPLTSPVADQD